MSAKLLVEYVSIAEFLLSALIIGLMWKRKLIADFPFLVAFLAVRTAYAALTIPVLFFRKNLGMSKPFAYNIYLFSYWPSFLLQAVLMVLIVYGVYSIALSPFEPLKKLGTIIFKWVGSIAAAVSIGVAVGPHMFGHSYAVNIAGQIQQTASVLTVCLLLFVCLALRPLGLTFGSRTFGASLGLGILATTQLLESAWIPTPTALSVYSPIYFYSGLAGCAALLVWGTYFAIPEPQRRMVLLPTTSPYFFWNKISEALNDAPGFVAVSGFTPDSLAPGELDALMAATQIQPVAAPRILQPVAVSR